MKYLEIIFLMVFTFAILSCHQKDQNKQPTAPVESSDPIKDSKNPEHSDPDIELKKTIEKPSNQNLKKKKLRALDTLKPISTDP